MRDSVRAAFVGFTAAFEGVVPWLYQDIKGLVTVAIGNLVDPIQYAMPLPFVDRVTGEPASRDAIMREWMRVKSDASLAKLGHRAAERVTTLRLTPEGIDLVVSRKLQQNDSHLRARFTDFEEWPACAQLATHSMAWACGPGFRFDRLVLALRMANFDEAAAECHIQEAGNPGIIPRNKANKLLYRNAARVQAFKLDPDLLEWEKDLDVSGVPTGPLPEEVTGSGGIVHKMRYEPEPEDP